MRARRLWATIAAAAGLALGVCGGASLAQPAQDVEESQPLYGKITPEEYTARILTRIATLDLRFVSQVGPRDYRIAAALFGIAEELTPDDEGIVRRRYEAAMAGGDADLALELTRKLAMLDKDDQMSLLRLLSGKIGRLQTVEERLALYQRLLSPAGKDLPAAIRSRLALDEALLLREQGDIDGFVDRLALSVKLDSTHKEAAALAATYYTDQIDDPAGQFQLLVNLLYADPLDPNVYESMARLLTRSGSWEAAKRFHDNGIALMSGPNGQLTDQMYMERQFLVWRTQGPQPVVDALNVLLEAVRKQSVQKLSMDYSKAVQEAKARGQPDPTPPQIDLSKVTLPPMYERLRLLAAQAAGDPATLEQAAANIELLQNQSAEQMKKAAPDEATAMRAESMAMLDLQTTRLWAGIQTEKVQEFARTQGLPAAGSQAEAMAQVFVGALLRLRTGDAQAAIDALLGFPDEVFLKDVGLALAYEQAGEPAKAAERLKRLASQPFALGGAWAISRLDRLKVPQAEVFPHAAEMSALAGVSRGLDRMITDPNAYMTMRVEPLTLYPGPLGQTGYRVTLKNTSPIPLSVGGDRVINTRLLFAPKMEADFDKVLTSAVPEVTEIDRRLRLEPGESFTAIVHPEYGWAGYSLEAAISRTTKIRWRILQGFGMAQGGIYQAGGTSLTSETPLVVRPALPETQLPVAALCGKLRDDSDEALPVVVAALRSLLTGPQRPDRTALLSDLEVEQAARAAAERYSRATPLARKMLLAGLPPAGMVPSMKPFDDACRSEQDPGVMALFLATRVSDDKDPILAAAALSADPKLGELARMLAERLATGTNTYARLPAQAKAAPGGAPGGQQPPQGGGGAGLVQVSLGQASRGPASDAPDGPGRKRWLNIAGFVVGVLLLGAALVAVGSRWQTLVDQWNASDHGGRLAGRWGLIALAVALPVANWLCTSGAFWSLTRRYGRVGAWEMSALIGTASLLNYLPLRPGLIGRVAYHRAVNGIPVWASVKVLVAVLACGGLAGAVLLGVAAASGTDASGEIAVAAVAAPGVVIAGVWGMAWAKEQPWECYAGAAFFRYLDMLAWTGRYLVAFRLWGTDLTLVQAVAVAGISQIASLIPLGGNGLGQREWSVGLMAAWFGLTHEVGLAADAVINRVGELVSAVPIGLIGWAWVARRVAVVGRSSPEGKDGRSEGDNPTGAG